MGVVGAITCRTARCGGPNRRHPKLSAREAFASQSVQGRAFDGAGDRRQEGMLWDGERHLCSEPRKGRSKAESALENQGLCLDVAGAALAAPATA